MAQILVCTDGSAYADSVYDHAAWAAGRVEASVEVLHVIDHHREHADTANWSGNMAANQRDTLLQQLAELDEQKSKLLQQRGREVLAHADSRLKEQGVSTVKLTMRNGHFVDEVAESEKSADLVIIGKRGVRADFAKMHLGSHLERVVRGSQHPVLVASRAFKPINKVLLAYDGSNSARNALMHVSESKLLNGLDLTLLMVGEETAANKSTLEEAATQLRQKEADTVSFQIKQGTAEQVIAETVKADAHDLLVVGAYGHSRIRQLIVGSTTTELVRSCLVPVLMIR